MNGYSFKFKEGDGSRKIGLLAQEVEKVIPEIVATDSEGYLSISYGHIVAYLVEGIKELRKENKELREENKMNKDQMLQLMERA